MEEVINSFRSIVIPPLARNKVIPFAIFTEVAVAVILCYAPVVNETLKFREIRGEWWLLGLPFGVLLLVCQELRKYVIRKNKSAFMNSEMKF